jgi:hypothetical protein
MAVDRGGVGISVESIGGFVQDHEVRHFKLQISTCIKWSWEVSSQHNSIGKTYFLIKLIMLLL